VEIICAECGQPFVRTSNVQKRCPACQAAAHKVRKRDDKRLRDLAKKQATFVCQGCDETFPKTLHAQRVCPTCKAERRIARSRERMRAWRGNKRAINPPAPKSFFCERCGHSFSQKFRSAHPRFCVPCGKEHKREADVAKTAKHRSENRQKLSERTALRRRTDPKFALRMSMSGAVYRSLRNGKDGASWEALVGYTTTILMAHLKRQFVKGISWKNYGSEWEVDHIRPVASFTFASPDDQGFKDCWALLNLRPLWRSANRSKRDRLIYLL